MNNHCGLIHAATHLAVALTLLATGCKGTDDEKQSQDRGRPLDYASVTYGFCLDICTLANNGTCDELDGSCGAGTDCSDCGGVLSSSTCEDTCRFSNDGTCDSPLACAPGTDCTDCAQASGEEHSSAGGAGGAPGTETFCNNTCYFANNGICESTAVCPDGTDCNDCNE